jgi:hypothetical protein
MPYVRSERSGIEAVVRDRLSGVTATAIAFDRKERGHGTSGPAA